MEGRTLKGDQAESSAHLVFHRAGNKGTYETRVREFLLTQYTLQYTSLFCRFLVEYHDQSWNLCRKGNVYWNAFVTLEFEEIFEEILTCMYLPHLRQSTSLNKIVIFGTNSSSNPTKIQI